MPAIPLHEAAISLFPELERDNPDSATRTATRSKDRAAQWQTDMARAYAYAESRARSPDDVAAASAAYEAALAEGPDFARYRRDSGFTPAPKINMDRNAIARLRFKLHSIYKGSWTTKEKGKHAGLIQRTTLHVFEALCALATKHGQVFPSLEGLAYLAKCSKNTVLAALKQLAFYGFITVHRRIKRIRTELGFKTVQDTNAYDLHEPTGWGQKALQLFGGLFSESNKWSARESNSYSNRRGERNSGSGRAINGPWDELRESWEAS